MSQESTAHRTVYLHRRFFSAVSEMCNAHLQGNVLGFSDVVVFHPKHICYRIVQESSVYTCTIRNQCACSSLPVIFFCCE